MTRGRVPNVWALEEDLHLPFKDAAWRSSWFFYSKQGGGSESERGRNSSGHRTGVGYGLCAASAPSFCTLFFKKEKGIYSLQAQGDRPARLKSG